MGAELLILSLDAAAIACAALLGARMLLLRPRAPVALLIALIAFESICHILLGRAERSYWIAPAYRIDVGALAPLMNLARNLTPAAFMALCHALFAEERRLPRWLIALVGVQMFLEEPAHWVIPDGQAEWLTEMAPALLQTLFAGMALYWTIATWRDDLVERRRTRLRPFTTLVIGVDILLSGLLTRVLIDPNSIANYYAHIALVGTQLALASFVLLQIRAEDLDAGAPVRVAANREPAAANQDDAALARLTALMGENVHREPGLTLKALADRVGLPDYRMRKLIHERLGFANFNAFLTAGGSRMRAGNCAIRRWRGFRF